MILTRSKHMMINGTMWEIDHSTNTYKPINSMNININGYGWGAVDDCTKSYRRIIRWIFILLISVFTSLVIL